VLKEIQAKKEAEMVQKIIEKVITGGPLPLFIIIIFCNNPDYKFNMINLTYEKFLIP
jgi:hypothetical protein